MIKISHIDSRRLCVDIIGEDRLLIDKVAELLQEHKREILRQVIRRGLIELQNFYGKELVKHGLARQNEAVGRRGRFIPE